jgi:aromatic ring-opening dioxygenase catalytic subunit (LigB family)
MDWGPPFGPHAYDSLRDYLAGIAVRLPERPKAVVVISGHWEARYPTVSLNPRPGMLFDYYGFPEHTYRLNYPAPGAPDIGMRVGELLHGAGIPVAADDRRGFDHGVFVPFLIMFPDADVPVCMLSMKHNMDAADHIAIGKALAPLRNEGVLIVGSGMSYHNLQHFADGEETRAAAFDHWLAETAAETPEARNARLADWTAAPSALHAHPRPDHLIPLMVVAGAAADDVGRHAFSDRIAGKAVSSFEFG